jgi:hypothetical protein
MQHATPTALYGTKVTFGYRKPVSYPDFSIEYLGTSSPHDPTGRIEVPHMKVRDFRVTHGDTSTLMFYLGWPLVFSVRGKTFTIEADTSEEFGALEDTEFVVWEGEKEV